MKSRRFCRGVMLLAMLISTGPSAAAQARPIGSVLHTLTDTGALRQPMRRPAVLTAGLWSDTSRAEPRHWATKGALIGAVIGVAAGAYTISNVGCGADASDRGCEVAAIAYITVLGTLAGALVGAVADWIIPHAPHPSASAAPRDPPAGRPLIR